MFVSNTAISNYNEKIIGHILANDYLMSLEISGIFQGDVRLNHLKYASHGNILTTAAKMYF